jgi:hypothetical protein
MSQKKEKGEKKIVKKIFIEVTFENHLAADQFRKKYHQDLEIIGSWRSQSTIKAVTNAGIIRKLQDPDFEDSFKIMTWITYTKKVEV